MPELVSSARCNKPAWREILFAWASPLPERSAVAPVQRALRKGTRYSLRSPGACLRKVKQAAWGEEEQEPLAFQSGNDCEAGEPALVGTAAGGNTSVTRSQCRESEAWLLRRHEGMRWAGRVIHSWEGVSAESMPVLSLWAQGDSSSLATCPWGRHALATSRLR